MVAGRLRPDTHLLHLPDEPGLAVATGWLCLLLVEVDALDGQLFAFLDVGDEVLAGAAVGIHRVVPLFEQAFAVGFELVTARFRDGAEVLPGRGFGDRREETPDDEFVDVPLVLVEIAPRR